MRLIKSSFEILEQESGLIGMFKSIERAGRTAYKSEDKITDDSYNIFVQRIIDSKHYSVLEHGTVYLTIPYSIVVGWAEYNDSLLDVTKNPYSKTKSDKNNYYITTNYRVIIEHEWEDSLNYQVDKPSDMHYKRVQVRMIIPISISREFNRHRTLSPTESSTRYCNYSKDKFNNEITFIEPYWYDKFNVKCIDGFREDGTTDMFTTNDFKESLINSESLYIAAIIAGAKPQEAREILPLCTASEVIYTAFIDDWKHFFELRCPASAHPQAREIAIPLKEEFINRNYI
jgi:thymidylate synthase (FAD)